MAALDSIAALLQALKDRRDGPSDDGDDTTGISASMVGDDPDDTSAVEKPDSQNDAIVSVLKNAYPKVYAKILGQLSQDDNEDEDMGDSAMVMPSMPPSAMQ